MDKHSNKPDIDQLRNQIIGLGEDSIKKSYYPKLRYHMSELERFRALLDQSKDMIILVDFFTRQIVDINYTVSLLYKKDKKDILSINANDFFPQEILRHMDIIKKGDIEELKNCCIVEVDIETPNETLSIEFSLQKLDFEDTSYIVLVGTNTTERKKAKEMIHQLDYYDSLTGLANKKMLNKEIKKQSISSRFLPSFTAMFFIDIDNFKAINDTQSHEIGDTLLIQVAQRLKELANHNITIYRHSGDEFLFLVTHLNPILKEAIIEVEDFAFRIKNLINQPYYIDQDEFVFSSSIGINLFQMAKTSAEEILKHAEIAMYEAKKDGRNTIRFYDPKMQEAIKDKISLEADLKLALERNEFCLYYQPQYDINENIIGLEALIRWNHPQKGLIPPNVFIPLAEENGFILPLGEWIVKEASSQLARFALNEKTKKLSISVNVSIKQFEDRYFYSRLHTILEETGAPSHKLLLELTESLFMHDIQSSIEKMEQIKNLQVSFSMDDFGTGYSSLSSLKKLPLYELKIDQSFIRDITVDTNDAIIVKTIIGMAKNLGLKVVAEGVETSEQLEFLKRYNCEIYQGYFFSKPLSLEALLKLLN